MFVSHPNQALVPFSQYISDIETFFDSFIPNSPTTIGVIFEKEDIPYIPLWKQFEVKYNLSIIPFLRLSFFSDSNEKEDFLFIYDNIEQKNLAHKVSQYLQEQWYPYINKHSLTYFTRIQYPLLQIKEHTIFDLLSNKTYLFPYMKVGEQSKPNTVFQTERNNVFSISKWLQQQNHYLKHHDSVFDFSTYLSEAISLSEESNANVKKRLEQEMELLKEKNATLLFFLAKHTKIKNNKTLFQGDFVHFLLSKKLNITSDCNPKPIDKLKERPLRFQIESTIQEKKEIMQQWDHFLKNFHIRPVFPYTKTKVLFHDFMIYLWQSRYGVHTFPSMETSFKWLNWKDEYDSYDSKEAFLEDNKFYSLFYPKEFSCFQEGVRQLENKHLYTYEENQNMVVFTEQNLYQQKPIKPKFTTEDLPWLHLPFLHWVHPIFN